MGVSGEVDAWVLDGVLIIEDVRGMFFFSQSPLSKGTVIILAYKCSETCHVPSSPSLEYGTDS